MDREQRFHPSTPSFGADTSLTNDSYVLSRERLPFGIWYARLSFSERDLSVCYHVIMLSYSSCTTRQTLPSQFQTTDEQHDNSVFGDMGL